MKRLLILGAGGHGRATAEAALASGDFSLVGFLDDYVTHVWGDSVLGRMQDAQALRAVIDVAIVAIGNNKIRQKLQCLLEKSGIKIATVVHPSSIVSSRSSLGLGCVVLANAVVNTGAQLGQGVIVNSGTVIDHDCVIGDFAHLGVNVAMAGGAMIGDRSWIQAGSVLGYGIKVSVEAVLPPGSVLKVEA